MQSKRGNYKESKPNKLFIVHKLPGLQKVLAIKEEQEKASQRLIEDR